MKRKLRIILAVALSVMLLVTAAVPAFAKPMDTTGHWAENVINKWVDNGWIKGYTDGSFKPDILMLKAEFAALTNRSLGFSTKANISALDVSVKDWFYGDMAKAVAAGYLTVTANGYMNPKALVSREDVAVMVAKMLGLDLPDTNEELDRFTDADDISSKNKAAVSAVVGKGIMQGYGNTFEPDEFLSRAQGITILDRIRNLLDDGSIQMTASLEEEPVAAAGVSPAPAADSGSYPGGGYNPGVVPPDSPATSPPPATDPTPDFPQSITGLDVSNGAAAVSFNAPKSGLTKDCFDVKAVYDGQAYTLSGLAFDHDTNTFTFDPLPHGFADKTLEVKVSAKAGNAAGISGEATDSYVINDYYNYISMDDFYYDLNSDQSWIGTYYSKFTLTDLINIEGIDVSLYSSGALISRKSAKGSLIGAMNNSGSGVDKEFSCEFPLPDDSLTAETALNLSSSIGRFMYNSDQWTEDSSSWSDTTLFPTNVIVQVTYGGGKVLEYDSQDTVYVDQNWEGNKIYFDNLGDNKIYGFNAFSKIQGGVDSVNVGGQVLVGSGIYYIEPNPDTGHYGVLIYKPLSLLGAQAGVKPIESEPEGRGDETVLVYSSLDETFGGGAISPL